MTTVIPVKRGLSSPAVTSIPDKWSKEWFRYFIDNFLAGADVRNVTGAGGISITGSNVSGNSDPGTPPSTGVVISPAPIANDTVLGNVSGISAIPSPLNQVQLTALINLFSSTVAGDVPASGGGITNFLRADGTWNTPTLPAIPNDTVLGNVSGSSAVASAITQTQLTTLINIFSTSLSGAVPASGGGTTSFLRADSSFAVPPNFTSTTPGYVPLSGGGTANFLRADGTFAAPATAVGANPSASVGLSAVNGSAPTFMRSDAAPALSIAISPVWSSNHIFTPSSGVAVTINGTVGNAAQTTNGAANSISILAVSGNSATAAFGDLIVRRNGSTVNSFSQGPSLKLEDLSGTNFSSTFQSSGGQTELWSGLGAAQNQIFKVLTTRGFTINTPASGATLTLGAVVNGIAFDIQYPTSGSAGVYTRYRDTTAAADRGYLGTGSTIFTGGAATDFGLGVPTGSALKFSIGGGTVALTIGSAGNVTISVPTSGDTLTVAPSVTTGALIATNAALTTGAGVAAGTITNAPSAGNPTKWIKINDNGTIRSIPAW